MNAVRRPIATVHKLFEEIPDNGHLPVRWNKVRQWGAQNAYTLIFLSLMFILTWIIEFLVAVFA